jgi:hypothetical protein
MQQTAFSSQTFNILFAAGLLTLLTAAIMSESAIDSAQNGINGIISSTFLKVLPVHVYAALHGPN